jgi:CRISPR-associated endonuclease Csn1
LAETRNINWKLYQSLSGIDEIIKVRINHLGRIVKIGEY